MHQSLCWCLSNVQSSLSNRFLPKCSWGHKYNDRLILCLNGNTKRWVYFRLSALCGPALYGWRRTRAAKGIIILGKSMSQRLKKRIISSLNLFIRAKLSQMPYWQSHPYIPLIRTGSPFPSSFITGKSMELPWSGKTSPDSLLGWG